MKVSDDHGILGRIDLLTVALLVELWLQNLILHFFQETLHFVWPHELQVLIVFMRQCQGCFLELFHKVCGQFLQWKVTVIQFTLWSNRATSTYHLGLLGLF